MRLLLTALVAGLAGLVAFARPAAAAPPVTTFELDNGMEVVVIEDHRAPVVTHMVWYRVGAADEPWGKSGIAHFFEHLMFKATDDLADGEFSQTVAENGGSHNAFTSWDYTGYYQRVAKDRLGLMMELEAERMRDLVLNEEVVATERDVILEERNSRVENDPGSLFNEQMRATLYMNHPYGVPVIGWRHEIAALGLKDATDFYARYYAPDNAILVVAGDVTPDEVRALAEKHYGGLEPSGQPADPRPQEPPQLAPRQLEMSHPDVRQPSVSRLYLVPNFTSADPKTAAALDVTSSVLGAGITSMLAETLEVEEKTAISTGAWYFGAARDRGSFGVYAVPAEGVSLESLEEQLDAVIERLKDEGPDEEMLERIKRNLAADEIYSQDSQVGLARLYGSALSVGMSVEDVQSWPDVVRSVTAEDVKRVANDWLVPARSVTGYLKQTPEAEAGEAG